jgi:hypothetical protein
VQQHRENIALSMNGMVCRNRSKNSILHLVFWSLIFFFLQFFPSPQNVRATKGDEIDRAGADRTLGGQRHVAAVANQRAAVDLRACMSEKYKTDRT